MKITETGAKDLIHAQPINKVYSLLIVHALGFKLQIIDKFKTKKKLYWICIGFDGALDI